MKTRLAPLLVCIAMLAAGCDRPSEPSSQSGEPGPTLLPSAAVPSATTAAATDTPELAPTMAEPDSEWLTVETAHAPSPRIRHAMAVLPVGSLLLFGGQDEAGNALADAWLFDPRDQARKPSVAGQAKRLTTPINRPGNAPSSEDWNPLEPPDSLQARFDHSMVTLSDGRVMLFGGENAEGDLFNDLVAFQDNAWASEAPAFEQPPVRSRHTAWAYEKYLHVLGGLGQEGAGARVLLTDLWRYDLEAQTWTQLQPPPLEVSPDSHAVSQGDFALIMDSAPAQESEKFLNLYLTPFDGWERVRLPTGWDPGSLTGYALVQAGDQAYLIGGAHWDADAKVFDPSNDVWVYDIYTQSWTLGPSLPEPRFLSEAAYDPTSGRIYVWGGMNGQDSLARGDTLLCYQPGP